MPSPFETIIYNRHLGFLIWQSISSSLIFLLFKLFFLPTTSSFLATLFAFTLFLFSHLTFSFSLSLAASPAPTRPLSPLRLVLAPFSSWTLDFRRRALLSLRLGLFVAVAAVSGGVSVPCVCWVKDYDGAELIWKLGFRGSVCGLLYGLFYVYNHKWVLKFPIVQRLPFFRFKVALCVAIGKALQFSAAAYLLSAVPVVFVADSKKVTFGKFIAEQIMFYVGIFSVFLCWELSHHLHRVLHTKRLIFAPPKGTAAAETNPSEPLLAALEESTSSSLLQYLAYLDLCMVCEKNVDTWRRAAFFEETSETYRRVIAVCLRPLEQLATKLGESMEAGSMDKACQLSRQMQSPTDLHVDSKSSEPLDNFQLCAWCARAVSSLTAHSRKEDRFGVAQLSGSNAAVITTLLSCLLAVEAFMGKKTNLQPPHHLMGPAGIKWAALDTGRRDVGIGKKRSGQLHPKAYAMADVLKTSIYCIVSAFHDETISSAKAGLLEKDWLAVGKPLFGTRELLLQKLQHFLDFRAS
ncbi:hypothetical protein Pint_16767 [Pistacia integerrima]|uniref:Uncharacterized protein n=1 Tax=Pistacia integerrima TaxID=434235 RepID=A0ACC0ZB61_9ROSI|nr:hypothetical protein Pint_16767 [Pistacia integerrima]